MVRKKSTAKRRSCGGGSSSPPEAKRRRCRGRAARLEVIEPWPLVIATTRDRAAASDDGAEVEAAERGILIYTLPLRGVALDQYHDASRTALVVRKSDRNGQLYAVVQSFHTTRNTNFDLASFDYWPEPVLRAVAQLVQSGAVRVWLRVAAASPQQSGSGELCSRRSDVSCRSVVLHVEAMDAALAAHPDGSVMRGAPGAPPRTANSRALAAALDVLLPPRARRCDRSRDALQSGDSLHDWIYRGTAAQRDRDRDRRSRASPSSSSSGASSSRRTRSASV